ncbi:MAG TPA: FtsW/RodA/SpoVE family cell cycle protein [Acidimicrobiales bacterium]|jgi:peptidoglycan glycosyltransferase|nr:FtsW/RodA/SpoVE family cell cycle protein [Acidimicrobiales bacterium]
MAVVGNPTYRIPARRRTELGLIVLAVLLTGGLYVLASLGKSGSLPANIGPFLVVVCGLLVVAHVAMRKLAPYADPVLLPTAALLNGIGYVFIARLDSHLAGLQALWTAFGVGAFLATLVVVRKARDLERYRYLFALGGIGLLLMPMLPVVGQNINGARLWVRVAGVSFQPGEMAKIALAIFFASYMVERREMLSRGTLKIGRFLVIDPKYIAPVLAAWALSLAIFFFENDLGSSFLFFALFIGMLWIATGRGWYLGLGAVLFTAGATVALKVIGHAKSRVQVWLNPWPVYNTSGYQIIQGWFAMAAGGLYGDGPGQGSPQRIPVVATDFIFAAIAEELGLLGAAALLAGYLLMVGTGLRIAVRCEQPFEKLLAAGLSMVVGIQVFVIVGGITRIIPLTGITLPFVSYGGSSLIANYILLALLLRISNDSSAPEVAVAGAADMTVAA